MQRDYTHLLARPQVAARLSVSQHTVKRWVLKKYAGFPEPIKVGPRRAHRWRAADIELWIDRQSRHPAPKRLQGALKEVRS